MNPLTQRLFQHSSERGENLAVFSEQGGSFCWRELSREVEDLSTQLPLRDTIAISLPSSPAFIVAILAGCLRNCHLVLLNPRWTQHECDRALRESGATHLVTASNDIVQTCELGLAKRLSVQFIDDVSRIPIGTAPSLVLFTSGTTSRPLAVARTCQQFWTEAEIYAQQIGLRSDDRIATLTPLCHAYALVDGLLGGLVMGASILPLSGKLTPRAILRKLAEYRMSVLVGVPVLHDSLARTDSEDIEEIRRTCRLLISAGSPLSQTARAKVSTEFQSALYDLYGTTETGTVAFQSPGGLSGVGQPMTGIKIDIRDGERVLGVGEVGAVHVQSEMVSKGYLGNVHSELFGPNSVDTRDRGWLDSEGCLHLVGRRGDVINVAGNKVDPMEVEEQLLQIPGIEEAVVIPVPSLQGDRVGAALRSLRSIELTEIEQILKQKLAAYKIPRILFRTDHIPRGPTGKVSRSQVAKRVMAEKVCVIVLTHRLLNHTQRCLEGLLKTDYPSMELVVVDNGSDDGTSEYLVEFRTKAAKAGVAMQLLLLSSNLGAARARNLGVQLSTAPLLSFVDNDTTFPDIHWLTTLIEAYRSQEGVGIVGPQLRYPFPPHNIQHGGGAISPDGRVGELGRGEPVGSAEFSVARDVQFLTTACWLMSREIFLQAGGFGEDYFPYYFEEIDLCYRVKSLGYRLRYEPNSVVYHYENATAATLGLDLPRIVARNLQKFKARWRDVFSLENGPSADRLRFRAISKPTVEELIEASRGPET